MLEIEIADSARVHVLDLATIPNPRWLHPGAVGAAQQAFGDGLLAAHPMVVLPSVGSSHSWNLLIDVTIAVANAAGLLNLRQSEPFAMDGRLNRASARGYTKP